MPCMLAPLRVFTDRCPLPVGSFHLRVFVCVCARAWHSPDPLQWTHAWRGTRVGGVVGKPLLGSGSGRTVCFPPCRTWC